MLYMEKAFQRCYEIIKNNPVALHLGKQRPKNFTDLHLILRDGWIAQDCQFLKCHEACRIGLRPPPIVHLLLHLLPCVVEKSGGVLGGLTGE